MKYEMIVFDWDGTLLDSAGAIVQSIQAACRDLDLPEPSDAQARHVIGLGLVDAMRQAVPDLKPERYQEMSERYRFHYLSGDHQLTLFKGIPELLANLQAAGHLLTIATGKSRVGLDRALDHSGLRPLFQASRCADECHSKPHPQMLLELMDEFFVAPENVLMIGDTTHDLQMAINAGVSALAVSYGAHTAPALDALQPLARLETPQGLSQWLLANA